MIVTGSCWTWPGEWGGGCRHLCLCSDFSNGELDTPNVAMPLLSFLAWWAWHAYCSYATTQFSKQWAGPNYRQSSPPSHSGRRRWQGWKTNQTMASFSCWMTLTRLQTAMQLMAGERRWWLVTEKVSRCLSSEPRTCTRTYWMLFIDSWAFSAVVTPGYCFSWTHV